jgi:hypothetical protein
MPKPHRVVLDRVTGYADEAAAFMRRRRHERRPFARVYWEDGRGVEHSEDSDVGDAMFAAAARLIDAAQEREAG